MKFDRQLRPETETSWVVSYGGKTIRRWRTAAILKIDISPYLSEQIALLSQKRPRDVSGLSVCFVASIMQYPRAQFFIISYFRFGFISAYNSIPFCCFRRNVKPCRDCVYSASDSFTTMALYKFTYLLT